MSDKSVEFVPLKGFENDYEIMNEYPFTIRSVKDHVEAEEFIGSKGYITVKLNKALPDKHKLIALQFIPNDDPEHKTQVDHRNKNKNDNHLENLRWVTPSQNLENRSVVHGITYEFVNELPDNVIQIEFYQSKKTYYEFKAERYYYDVDEEEFYVKLDENMYKKLHICIDKYGSELVNLRDINNKHVCLYVRIFKIQHDLI